MIIDDVTPNDPIHSLRVQRDLNRHDLRVDRYISIDDAENFLNEYEEEYYGNPDEATLGDYLEYQKDYIKSNLTAEEELEVLFYSGEDDWHNNILLAASDAQASDARREAERRVSDVMLLQTLEYCESDKTHLYEYCPDRNHMPKLLFEELKNACAEHEDDWTTTISQISKEAIAEYLSYPKSERGDEYIDIKEEIKNISDSFKSNFIELDAAGDTFDEISYNLNEDIYDFDDALAIMQVYPDAMWDALRDYDVSDESIDEAVAGLDSDDILEALDIVKPDAVMIVDDLQSSALKDAFSESIGSFSGLRIGAYVEKENLDYPDTSDSLQEIIEKCKKNAKATSKLLNVRRDGDTLIVGAGKSDIIPSNMFDFSMITEGRKPHNIKIDDSIHGIAQKAFFSIEKLITVDSIFLPKNVKYDIGKDKAESPFFNFFADKTYDGHKELQTGLVQSNLPGMTSKYSAALIVAEYMQECKVPLTAYNISRLGYEAFHIGTYDMNASFKIADALCHDYIHSGLERNYMTTLETDKNNPDFQKIKGELSEDFKENYSGHVPRIIDDITSGVLHGNISEDFAKSKRFNVKETAYAVKHGIPLNQILPVTQAYSKDSDFHKIIASPNLPYIAKAVKEHSDPEKTRGYVDFMVNHPDTNEELLSRLDAAHSALALTGDTSVAQAKVQLEENRSLAEVAKIRDEYPKFNLSDLKCELKNADVHLDGCHAYIMKADDPRQVMLGYDTSCCQHLGNVGESAMMYGLLHPQAGFFVIEDEKSGKILAQGESWERDPDTLVFDNLEFADDRQVGQFAPILAKWADTVGYSNVYTGIGFNQLTEDNAQKIRREKGIVPPSDPEVPYPYTDARNSVGVIKENNVVEPFFADAYKDKEGKSLVSEKPEKPASLPSLDDILGNAEEKQSGRNTLSERNKEDDLSL